MSRQSDASGDCGTASPTEIPSPADSHPRLLITCALRLLLTAGSASRREDEQMRIADFKDRDVEGLDWLLGTVGTPAPELVEPPCAQIVRMNPENRLGKAGRV
jgi:hypothetical protein